MFKLLIAGAIAIAAFGIAAVAVIYAMPASSDLELQSSPVAAASSAPTVTSGSAEPASIGAASPPAAAGEPSQAGPLPQPETEPAQPQFPPPLNEIGRSQRVARMRGVR